MEHADLSALPYRGYLIGTNSKENPYKISRHHIIPQNILDLIKNYKCKDSKDTPFCKELLDGIEGEFCGNAKPDLKKKEPFLWETGNLYLGPSQTYRTEDSKSGFDESVIPLLDCIGTDRYGTRLQSAFYSLMAYKDDVIEIKRISENKNDQDFKQEEIKKINDNTKLNPGNKQFYIDRINEVVRPCDKNSADFFCITAAQNLNLFYKGFCGVRNHPLYELDFYLKNFWRYVGEVGGKKKFRLLEGDEIKINCEAINHAASLSSAIAGYADLVASMQGPKTVFLEGEAVVSNHFHKTKTADASSSFILDDSVDARF